jgi:hypothetical protein
MTAVYSRTSPYYGTTAWGQFLDVWTPKYVSPSVTDMVYQIDPPYNYRPDLLAQDLYQNVNFWWVFAVRNPDILKDPLYDFVAPTIIYIPTKENLLSSLGL